MMNELLYLLIFLGFGVCAAVVYFQQAKSQKAIHKFKQIFDNGGELLFVLDTQGCVTDINSMVIELLGMDRPEIIGMRFDLLLDFNKECIEDEYGQVFTHKEFTGEFVEYGRIVSLDVHLLNRVHHRLPVLISGKKLFNSKNNHIGFSLTARDMRFQKENQLQVIQNSKMAAIHLLTAGVAHEVNNPLMILKGNLDILKLALKDQINKNEKIGRLFDKQKIAITRISKIISGLRDYSRTRKNLHHIFDVNQVISNILGLLQSGYKEQGVIIEADLKEGTIDLNGESSKFNQILSCLISNAVDAVSHVDNPRVLIETETFEGMGVLRVSDNGAGIEQKNLLKIFDMFYTTKPGSTGTGMGLGIINRLITEMDGHIYVNSKVGKGTSFYLEFPLANAGVVPGDQTTATQYESLSGRAIFVDDDEHVCEIVEKYLTDLGLEVDVFTSPGKALKSIKEKHYDYILTDYLMPEMQGDHFIKMAKNVSHNPSAHYYVVTGVLELKKLVDEEAHEIYDSIEKVILKPFSKIDLYKALRLAKATIHHKLAS